MENILAAVVGAALGGLLALASVFFATKSDRRHWRRELQIRIASDAMTALQRLVREITNVAYLAEVPHHHKMGRFVNPADIVDAAGDVIPDISATPPGFFAAVTNWNSALHQILVAGTPALADRVRAIDEEMDRLLDNALYHQWTRQSFRKKRAPLGRLMAEFIDTVRGSVGLRPISMTSVWTWDTWDSLDGIEAPAVPDSTDPREVSGNVDSNAQADERPTGSSETPRSD